MENKNLYSKVLIIGSGQLAYKCAIEVLKYIKNVCVYELKITDSTVLEKLCIKDGVFYEAVNKEYLTEILLREQEKTLIVSAGSIYLIPKEIIKKQCFTIINWHNALLPFHKGRNAEAWAIYEGDESTGITWHYVVEAVDQGEIIAQEEIKIDKKITALMLLRKQYDSGFKVFVEILPELLNGKIKAFDQVYWKEQIRHLFITKDEKIHYSYEIPNDGYFDFMWDFEKANCFLRAMDYGSLSLLGNVKIYYDGKKYSAHRYRIEEKECPEYMRGTIEMDVSGQLIVYYDKHIITFKELQGEN